MRTIGIDCRFADEHAGLGRYTRSIVLHMVAAAQGTAFVLFVRDPAAAWLHTIRDRVQIVAADIPHYSFAEQTLLPRLLQSSGIDLLFSPHFNVPLRCPVPFVVTVHDLILHRYPNQASVFKQYVYRLVLKRALKRAQAVIAVSHFTAAELAETYGDSVATKTTVITEGVEEYFAPASPEEVERVRRAHSLPPSFFLYVGNAKQHKRVDLLLKAYAALPSSPRELVLVSGGKEAVQLSLPPGARLLQGLDDRDLPALYSAADAFVTASAYEGFGLPLVEALACGCPVIATRGSAVTEVIGNDGTLTEPSVEGLAHAMAQLPTGRRAPVRRFAWSEAAEETAALLEKVPL
jgi:glycosyltransferase involved in cell wall biosynthesis